VENVLANMSLQSKASWTKASMDAQIVPLPELLRLG